MSGLYYDSEAVHIGFTVTISLIVVTDLIGNTFVIFTILTNKSMKSPMNYLLLNLAIADVLVGFFMMPRFLFNHFLTYPKDLAGKLMCTFFTHGIISWTAISSAVITLVAVCFERYFCIVHPYSTNLKLTLKKIKGIVIGSWMFAVVINIPLFLIIQYDKETKSCVEEWPKQLECLSIAYSILWFVFAGFIPITIMIVLYSRVIYILWFKNSEHQVQGTQLAMLRSRKRVSKMVIIVSVIYAVCWLPVLIMYLFYYGKSLKPSNNFEIHVAYTVGVILVTSSSAINPFIYAFQSERFRQHFKEFLCCRIFRRNRIDQSRLNITIAKPN